MKIKLYCFYLLLKLDLLPHPQTLVQLIIFSGPSGEPVRHSLGQPPCAHHKHLDKSLASAGLDEVTTHLIL